MSGIPTPRSGIARPSRNVALGNLPKMVVSSKRKETDTEKEVGAGAAKRAKMAPPPVKKATVASAPRKPLATRNASTSRSNLGGTLNRTIATVEHGLSRRAVQPSAEKTKGNLNYNLSQKASKKPISDK